VKPTHSSVEPAASIPKPPAARGRHRTRWIGQGTVSRSFWGANGDAEHYICVEVPSTFSLSDQIQQIQGRYAAARRELGLAPETAIFRRLFLSDTMNQAALVRESGLAVDAPGNPVAVSIVQQPPLPGAKVALLAYHVESGDPVAKRRLSSRHVLVEKRRRRELWSTRLCSGASASAGSAASQTRDIFDDLIHTLVTNGANLHDHCIRTWIYLKDVDVFYQGMVDSRRKLFAQHGLTASTHFIASTGIEGACAHRHDLVAMDAYSILDLDARQISYLNDFDRLCPTKNYNVTFERGTRVAYADRAHHLISGTASIDNAGEVVHPGDVLRQLDRALENVDALLRSGGAELDQMMYLLVYLRDPTDFARVNGRLYEHLAGMLPILIVQGPVCRPEWLVEVEGVAIAPNDDPLLPPF
jgi:enamine deaminase RidA (YjgF/YER057c/UK114 family)